MTSPEFWTGSAMSAPSTYSVWDGAEFVTPVSLNYWDADAGSFIEVWPNPVTPPPPPVTIYVEDGTNLVSITGSTYQQYPAPSGLSFVSSNDQSVTSIGSTIYMASSNGSLWSFTNGTFTQVVTSGTPGIIAASPAGQLYGITANQVLSHLVGNAWQTIQLPTGPDAPGFAIDVNGAIYEGSLAKNANKVYKLLGGTSATPASAWTTISTPTDVTTGIAVHGSTLYASSSSTANLYSCAVTATSAATVAAWPTQGYGLSADSAGNIYSNTGAKIYMYNPSTGAMTTVGSASVTGAISYGYSVTVVG